MVLSSSSIVSSVVGIVRSVNLDQIDLNGLNPASTSGIAHTGQSIVLNLQSRDGKTRNIVKKRRRKEIQ